MQRRAEVEKIFKLSFFLGVHINFVAWPVCFSMGSQFSSLLVQDNLILGQTIWDELGVKETIFTSKFWVSRGAAHPHWNSPKGLPAQRLSLQSVRRRQRPGLPRRPAPRSSACSSLRPINKVKLHKECVCLQAGGPQCGPWPSVRSQPQAPPSRAPCAGSLSREAAPG